MNKKPKATVAKEIYRQLAQIGEWVPSGAMEEWNCLGATGSTITRKARLLQNDKWIAVRYVDGCAEYRALKTQAERDAYTPTDAPEAPNLASRDELPAPKYRYEPVYENGRLTRVKQIAI